MTQRFSLWEDLTIRENLEFIARMYGMTRPQRGGRAQRSSRSRPDDAARAARGHAVRRLEAAPRARRLHAARARSCCCSTSRPPASTRRRGATSGRRSTRSRRSGISVLCRTHYMDEAERCHRLAYIAYGKLLARARADEVHRSAGARRRGRCRGRPARARGPARSCAAMPGIAQVAAFGTTLHVTGDDAAALRSAPSSRCGTTRRCAGAEVDPGLEDVFIHLMKPARTTSSQHRARSPVRAGGASSSRSSSSCGATA